MRKSNQKKAVRISEFPIHLILRDKTGRVTKAFQERIGAEYYDSVQGLKEIGTKRYYSNLALIVLSICDNSIMIDTCSILEYRPAECRPREPGFLVGILNSTC
jgi:hypothetical protein